MNISAQFPQEKNTYYLNHAAVSPWPDVARQAVVDFANENVVHGARYYPNWMSTEQSLRERLRALINADSTDEIALAKSTSEALSMIAYGLTWNAGDEVIISNQEFPSNRIVWESLADQGVSVVTADISDNALDNIKNCISGNTRLLAISSVQYASGQRIDLEALGELCREHQVLLCVDAIQSLGAIPFDQAKIKADFVVADGHKWMMGAEGLALFYVKKELQAQLKLHQYGWHMVKERGNYDKLECQAADDATRFECGSPNMLGVHVLNASLGLILEIGVDDIHQELENRITYLITQLDMIRGLELISPREPMQRGGIVTFKPPHNNLKKLHQELMESGVICAHRGGGIRFSPHFYTSYQTIDTALTILRSKL